jgi:hypothetical protein
MNVRLINVIYHLNLEENLQKANLSNYTITNSKVSLINNFGDRFFGEQLGASEIRNIENNYFIYYVGNAIKTGIDLENLSYANMAMLINNYLSHILNSLWFIKDNAVFANKLYLFDLDLGTMSSNIKDFFISNSSGKYDAVVFTKTEFDFLNLILEKTLKLFSEDKSQNIEFEVSSSKQLESQAATDQLNFLARSNKLQRAFTLLHAARRSSLLPLKIANYVMVLECLFGPEDGTEISHKVKERVVLYVGGIKDIKNKNWKLIADAYGIRSKYVHGQGLSGKFLTEEKLVPLSNSLDELLRQIFRRIILYDSDVFLQSSAQLQEYFKDLILG